MWQMVRTGGRWIGQRLRLGLDLRDAVSLLGLATLAAGLAAIDWRLALVVVGVLLLVLGNWTSIVGAFRRANHE